MSLKLSKITFFVNDMDKATKYYSETLKLTAYDIRPGWSGYKVSKDLVIAFHKGSKRHPRLTFTTYKNIEQVREELNKRGAKLAPVKDFGDGLLICKGRDPDGLMIEIANKVASRKK